MTTKGICPRSALPDHSETEVMPGISRNNFVTCLPVRIDSCNEVPEVLEV